MLLDSIKASLVDQSIGITEEKIDLIVNDATTDLSKELKQQLKTADEFIFVVAFITQSGVNVLLEALKNKKIKGKILTTDYLNFSDPQALQKLRTFENIELKVYTKENFHIKGYMFKHGEQYEYIVGSANLTQEALLKNKEWNLKITANQKGALVNKFQTEFTKLWQEAEEVTTAWLEEYQKNYQRREISSNFNQQQEIKPNQMQQEALQSLANLRAEGTKKALVISATGTGKTYLAAFDVKQVQPKKMLFIAHREQILQQAMTSFAKVIGPKPKMALLSGNNHPKEADYLFATIQTISKPAIYQQITPDYFDYMIIDESHRSGAKSYQKIIDYFKPQFMLGMTATPERTDEINIYELFDYNIAYEIRLQTALAMDLLTPFHYFGITGIDGKQTSKQNFNDLPFDNKVTSIINNIEYYGYAGLRVKGLIFCRSKNEAEEYSKAFNKRGYQTTTLFGTDSIAKRQEMIAKLRQEQRKDGLDYIFTVDVFNEGIDIPEINQIVMLRPTESVIVFVQQLGRGLRKNKGKEYVNVIDFIDNYDRNYLIPAALSGKQNYNKEQLIQTVSPTFKLPGCSTIDFDEIARERIYEAISTAKMDQFKQLKTNYLEVKNKLNHIPLLMELKNNGEIDPSYYVSYQNKGYHYFLEKLEKKEYSDNGKLLLKYLYTELCNGLRPHELTILALLKQKEIITLAQVAVELKNNYHLNKQEKELASALRLLTGQFLVGKHEHNLPIIQVQEEKITFSPKMKEALTEPIFVQLVEDIIAFGLNKYTQEYQKANQKTPFIKYKKYNRKDLCRLLNSPKYITNIYGYPRQPIENIIPIFINYNNEKGLYDNQFIGKKIITWFSRPNLTATSKEVENILQAPQLGYSVQLFMKKNADTETKFYYLGEVKVHKYEEMKQADRRDVVKVWFELTEEIDEALYEYLVN